MRTTALLDVARRLNPIGRQRRCCGHAETVLVDLVNLPGDGAVFGRVETCKECGACRLWFTTETEPTPWADLGGSRDSFSLG